MKAYLFFFLSLFAFLVISPLLTPHVKAEKPQIVNISIIIENSTNFDVLSSWLDSLNYTHFTFVLWEQIEDSILYNNTRLNKLKLFGEIIPRRDYLQQFSPQDRLTIIDNMIAKYNTKLGYTPKGVMMFIPDAYTLTYLYVKGFDYVQGYCFEQWAIDYMSMKGGFQLPYYASDLHALIPSQSKGIIVFPHNTWDWVDSLKISHDLNTHPINLWKFFGNETLARDYWFKLIGYSLDASNPFGYVSIQFEWQWLLNIGWKDIVKNWIQTLITTRPYTFMTYGETAQWFKQNYPQNPTYTVNFVSPYSNTRIEWLWNNQTRIARIGQYVVSYINYANQSPDKYITQTKSINWGLSSNLDVNCIDISLDYKIDALGGGYLRDKPHTSPYFYTENLENFPAFYYVNNEMIKEIFPLWAKIFLIFALLGICLFFVKRGLRKYRCVTASNYEDICE
jgi:hypothetical protein